MQIRLAYFLPLLLLAFASCDMPDVKEPAYDYVEVFENDNYAFQVGALNRGDTAQVFMRSQGMGMEFRDTFQLVGEVIEVEELDLDKDGRPEFYTIAKDTKSGDINLLALYENDQQRIRGVDVKDPTIRRVANTDKVYVKDGALYRQFVVDGQLIGYTYKLSPTNDGVQLVPQRTYLAEATEFDSNKEFTERVAKAIRNHVGDDLTKLNDADRRFSYERVDLKGDDEPEVLVQLQSSRWCSSGGGCTYLLIDEDLNKVTETMQALNPPFYKGSSEGLGWADLYAYTGGKLRHLKHQLLIGYPKNPSEAPVVDKTEIGEEFQVLFGNAVPRAIYKF